jgi:hypothetical protein
MMRFGSRRCTPVNGSFDGVPGKGLSFPECGSGVVRLGLVASILPDRRAMRPQTAQCRDVGDNEHVPQWFLQGQLAVHRNGGKESFFQYFAEELKHAFVAESSGKPRFALILL